jgi:hypothetical protein
MGLLQARRAVCGALVGLVSAALIALAQPADARSTFDSAYGFDRTYNAALRLVRVDMGLKITEKDDKSGYFVFDYSSPESGNKVSSGSIQFVRSPEADAPIRVVVQLPAMPRSHEQVLVDSLVRKMRQDYGDPPERPKQPVPAQPPGEGGTDGGEDAE